MIIAGYCLASFLAGALTALLVGLFIAGLKRNWIIEQSRKRFWGA